MPSSHPESQSRQTAPQPHHHRHAQQGLPRSAPWVLPSIVSNPLIEQCAIALLGPCYFQTNNGNTNLPGSGTQPLHVVRPRTPLLLLWRCAV